MAFETNRPFGFGGGFEPGRRYAASYAAMSPEVFGLDVIGEAANQARQFPVIAGGGRGLAIPGLSQVEETGGPSRVGEEAPSGAPPALLEGLNRETRVGEDPGRPSWAQLALMGGGTALKAGKFGRELFDLGFLGPSGPSTSPSGAGRSVGGELGIEAPGAGAVQGGDLSLGTVGRGVNTLGDILSLAGQISGEKGLGYAGTGVSAAGSALSGDYLNPIGAIANAAIQAAGKENDPDAQAGQRALSTTMTLANAILSQTWVGAAIAAALRSAMAIYGGLEANKSGEEITTQALYAGTPVAMFDLGGNISEHISDAFGPSKAWRNFPRELAFNEGQQGTAFSTLSQALPYVQNKEELARLVKSANDYVAMTTGLTPEPKGTGPYALASIPGTTGTEHGVAAARVDWGPQTQALQALIDALGPALPGEDPTGPVSGLGNDEAGMRLWMQFLDRERNAPVYQAADYAGGFIPSVSDPSSGTPIPGRGAGFYAPGEQYGLPIPNVVGYGQSGYRYNDPASGYGVGWPEPGQYVGTISPYWLALMQGGGPANTPGRAMVAA